MNEDNTKNDTSKEVKEDATNNVAKDSSAKTDSVPAVILARRAASGAKSGGQKREFTKNKRQPRRRPKKERSEFNQKILSIRRVTRVSAGGRRFSFSVAIVIGDGKGRVGVGTGKAGDTSLAIDKAVKAAKRNLITVETTGTMSIAHDAKAKYCSARVMIMPAPNKGVIAGSAARDIIELAGLKDINAKIISGTKNRLNIAQAMIKALNSLKTPIEPKKKAPVKKSEK